MFIVIAKIWEQSKCLLIDKCIKNVLYGCTMNSATIKKKILPFFIVWRDLKYIMLSEIRQKKDKYMYVLTYMWNKKNSPQKQRRMMVARR